MAEFDTETPVDPIRMGIMPEQFRNIANQIGTFLDDPRARAGLINAGLSLMAGNTWGDTPSSAIARSIGRAGEGVTAHEEETRKQELAESKMDVAESRANTAAARAAEAGARTDIARERLSSDERHRAAMREKWGAQADLAERNLTAKVRRIESQIAKETDEGKRRDLKLELDRTIAEGRREVEATRSGQRDRSLDIRQQGLDVQRRRGVLEGHLAVDRAYRESIKPLLEENAEIEKNNRTFRQNDPLKPVPSKQEWLRQNPGVRRSLGAEDEDGDDDAPPPPTRPRQPAPQPTTTGQHRAAPANPADRVANETYMTPRGLLRWTGTGWVNP